MIVLHVKCWRALGGQFAYCLSSVFAEGSMILGGARLLAIAAGTYCRVQGADARAKRLRDDNESIHVVELQRIRRPWPYPTRAVMPPHIQAAKPSSISQSKLIGGCIIPSRQWVVPYPAEGRLQSGLHTVFGRPQVYTQQSLGGFIKEHLRRKDLAASVCATIRLRGKR